MRFNILFFFTVLVVTSLWGQEDAELVYDGNKLFNSGRIPESATKYSRALEKNPGNKKANFNLGNSLYKNAELIRTGKLKLPEGNKIPADSMANMIYDKAAQNFAIVANSVSDKDTLHRAWHNIGNCYLKKKEYKEAVEAYKKSLKFDPKDEETRYNLAYALKNLPKDKSGGGGKSPPEKEQKKEEKKDSKAEQPKMSKEQAEQLLKALMDSERKLQDKRKQKQEDASKGSPEKDW